MPAPGMARYQHGSPLCWETTDRGTHETAGEIWGQRPHAAVTPLVAAPAERLSHQEKIRGKFPSVLMNE